LPRHILSVKVCPVSTTRCWEQHVRRPRFQQVERPHWDEGLFTSRVSFL